MPGDWNAEMQPHERIVGEIARERERQLSTEGLTQALDDELVGGELARAAAAYAIHVTMDDGARDVLATDPECLRDTVFYRRYWPFSIGWWKPKGRRDELVKAAALIVAEIERLDRRADVPKRA